MNGSTSTTQRRRLLVAVLSAMLALGVFVAPVAAGTPCSVWSLSPTTDGNWAYGTSRMDCPTSPKSDWLKSELVEWAFPGAYYLRDSGVNNTDSSSVISVYTSYYCNGHGTDDWQVKANGRDKNGGESGWLWGSSNSLTC